MLPEPDDLRFFVGLGWGLAVAAVLWILIVAAVLQCCL